jgi:hypothetical protein
VYDLFAYPRGPLGRVKTLAHRRGDPLAGGTVHNARQGIVKARRMELRPGRDRRRSAERDARIFAAWRALAPVVDIAAAEGISTSAVYYALHRAGAVLNW